MFSRRENKENTCVKVSVLMLSYNQEEFIAQAIDSALNQQVDFYYEIVVGDDCSTDNTRGVLLDYQQKHSDRIRLLLHKQNLGFLGKKNLTETFKDCQGEYIAILEGDDFWTSPDKLQKQADFLDNQQNCAACYHDVTILNENGSQEQWPYPGFQKKIYTLDDLLGGNFIPTCSVMFRNGLFAEFPQWFFQSPMGDWPLHILNAHYGDIGFIDEVMGVYRIHSGGIWSSKNQVDTLHKVIHAAETMQQGLSSNHREKIENSIGRWFWEIKEIQLKVKNSKRTSLPTEGSRKDTHSNKVILAKEIVKDLRLSGRKARAAGIIQYLQENIFALAAEKDFKLASLCAKKFLCAFGHRKEIARTDLINLILSVDFPRVHKILASLRSTALRKYHGWHQGNATKYPSTQ
jgi:glycosyltransferase involved in cell wall biosynthesis